MANLPIPDFGLTTAEAPRSSVSGDIFKTSPQQSIAPGLAALGDGVDALAVKAAESQARQDLQKSVTRDADGNVQVATPQNNFILGRAGEAYQKTFDHGAVSGLQNQNAQNITELRQQFPLDPQGFKVAAAKYVESIRSKYPGALGEAAYENANRLATQHYDGLVNAKASQDVQNSYQQITTRIQGIKNDMLQIARQDGIETDAFGNSAGMLKAQYDALVANPRFGITKEKAAYEMDNFAKEAKDQFVIGKVRQVRDREGADAAIAWAEKEIRDKPGGVPAENEARLAMARAEVGRLTDQQRADMHGANATAQSYIQLYHGRTPPTDAQVDAAIESSRRTGDVAGASALRAARDAYTGIRPILGVTQQGMASASSGRVFNPASLDSYLDRTKQIENPTGNPAAVSPTGAKGDFQFTRGTAAQYGVTDPTNPAQAREGARRLAIDNAAALKSALGRDPTEAEVYLAHQQGATGTQALLQHPEMNAVQALATYAYKGNLAKADQAIRVNGGNPTMTAGQFAQKWIDKFNGGVSPASAGPTPPIPFSAERLARDPSLGAAAASQYLADKRSIGQFVGTQVDAMTTMVKMGLVAPNPADLASVMQIAQQYPEHAPQVSKLVSTVEAARMFDVNAASPTPVSGTALVEQARQMAKANPSIYSLQRLQAAQEIQSSQDALQKQDPRAYGARIGWNTPATPFSQLSAPDQIGPALEQRRQASIQIAGRMGGAPADYMFTGPDVGDIHDMLAGADGAKASSILGALARGLKPDEMVALAGDKNFTSAVAGLMRSGNPQKMAAAYTFMDGQYQKNPIAFEKEYGSDVVTKMHVWQDKIAFMNPEAAMKEIMRSDDPATMRAKESLRADAEKAQAAMTPEQAAKVFGSWIPFMSPSAPVSDSVANGAAALRDDYRQLYRDYYAESNGDKSIAEKRSLERMQQKWGASKLNDGRLMAYPPEKYYPKDMNGKNDYFRDQLHAEIAKFAGETGIEVPTEYGPQIIPTNDAQQRAYAIASGAYAIVADQSTMADIASHRLPSYRVVVQDKTGKWNLLEQASGQFMRFRADPQAAMNEQRKGMEAKRDQIMNGAPSPMAEYHTGG